MDSRDRDISRRVYYMHNGDLISVLAEHNATNHPAERVGERTSVDHCGSVPDLRPDLLGTTPHRAPHRLGGARKVHSFIAQSHSQFYTIYTNHAL